MRTCAPLLSLLGVSLSALLAPGPALAAPPKGATSSEVKKACVAEADKGQELRSAGKLSSAKEQFARCSRDECPGPLRQDCAQWMNEVVAAQPSIVVGARDDAGRDIVDVRVLVDGQEVAGTLDGHAITVDPGVHELRYERAGSPAVEEKVVVRAGEKNRALTVVFRAPGGQSDVPTPKSAPAKAGASTHSSGPPTMAWVLGGVGVVALGAAVYLDLSASSDVDNLRHTCAPNCKQSQVDSVRTRYTVAGVAAGVGAVSLGFATYLFLSKPSKKTEQARLSVALSPLERGGHASLHGAF